MCQSVSVYQALGRYENSHVTTQFPSLCSMSTIGQNARVQMFAKVIDSFVDDVNSDVIFSINKFRS